jgi:hypothetical protein
VKITVKDHSIEIREILRNKRISSKRTQENEFM